MARRSQFLVNDIDPAYASPTTEFDVNESAIHLAVMGLSGVEFIAIEQRLTALIRGKNEEAYYWAPLYRGGCPVILSGNNSQHLELIPGNYRLALTRPYALPIVVTLNEDESMHTLADTQYIYAQPPACPVPVTPPVPCPTPDLLGAEPVFMINRCDALGNVVSLVYRMVTPDNTVCPQVPGGPQYVGFIDETGVFSAAPIPAGLVTCPSTAVACPAAAAQGVLSTWG